MPNNNNQNNLLLNNNNNLNDNLFIDPYKPPIIQLTFIPKNFPYYNNMNELVNNIVNKVQIIYIKKINKII